MNGYIDGKMDCRVPDCPLYGSMPFRESKDMENDDVLEQETAMP